MIDFLRGRAAHIESDYVVVDVQGVGYRVFVTNPYAFQQAEDEQITVYIHHHVRDDAILLYGFSSRQEQSLFKKLIDVTGIGPRVALGILSGGQPEAIVAAIQQENIAFLTKLPGIGKKTAQRMILDLKDKLDMFDISTEFLISSEATAAGPTTGIMTAGHPAWEEAKEGLLALGISEAETERVWQQVQKKMKDGDGVEQLMKLALQSLHGG